MYTLLHQSRVLPHPRPNGSTAAAARAACVTYTHLARRWSIRERRNGWTLNALASDFEPESLPEASTSSPAEEEELDDKEKARRERISKANAGKVPWNKGRKHSPETIAKIRQRTMEAMMRKEVADRVKHGLEKRQQVHSEETRAKISAKVRAAVEAKRIAEGRPSKEEVAAAKEEARRKKEEAAAAKALLEGPSASKRRRKKPAAAEAGPGQEGAASSSDPANTAPRRKRESNSDEHRKHIAETIRKKWEDPEYREYMCQKMRESAARRLGLPPPEPGSISKRRSRAKAKDTNRPGGWSSGGSGSGAADGSGAVPKPRQRSKAVPKPNLQKEWLQHVQLMVDQLLASKRLLGSMEQKIREIQNQAQDAFVNDPVMSARLQQVLQQVEERRRELAESVKAQQAKIPSNVGFDDRGVAFLKPETGESAEAAAASTQGSGMAAAAAAAQQQASPPPGSNQAAGWSQQAPGLPGMGPGQGGHAVNGAAGSAGVTHFSGVTEVEVEVLSGHPGGASAWSVPRAAGSFGVRAAQPSVTVVRTAI